MVLNSMPRPPASIRRYLSISATNRQANPTITNRSLAKISFYYSHFARLAAARAVMFNYFASMRFRVLLCSLLPLAVIVPTAAVPELIDIQHNREDQNN
jgi:hypothetical protein